jgi:hypothetical protein
MSANGLPSSIALLAIAIAAVLFSAAVIAWHRFGPTSRTLHNLLDGLSPQFARLITADYAEQVIGAETDGALAQLAYLGLVTSRAYALGRANLAELHAVTRALSRAYGTDFAKIAGKGAPDGAVPGGGVPDGEPDLVDLARRLGIFGFPADLSNESADHRGDKLHLFVPSSTASPFVGKAVACACADEPKPFLAAQYAREAWKAKQPVAGAQRPPLNLGLPGAGGLWSVRSGHSTIAGARSAAELVDSQIELAGHYAYSGPAALASLTRASQFAHAEQSQVSDPGPAGSK